MSLSSPVAQSDVLDPQTVERLTRIGGTNLLRQLIDLFLKKAPHHLETLRNVDDLAGTEGKLAAHSLVATAGNLGATRLSQLAHDLEVELAGADMHQIRLLQPQVLAELERAVGELARLRAHVKGAPDEDEEDRDR